MTLPADLSQAIERVMQRFRQMVLGVGARHALRGADVDELVQDVRVRIWKGRTTSEEIESLPTSYIYQTAKSAALDMMRRRRREAARTDEIGDEAVTAVAGPARADDPASLRELERQVESALAQLVPSRRVVVRMSLAGYERQQIVERLGWSEGKVRNLLSRGMNDLRTHLSALMREDTTRG
jgi:RNA polymerase sigma-70 factor (ECF subfamily)